MSNETVSRGLPTNWRFQLPRMLFIFGFAMFIVLTFVPTLGEVGPDFLSWTKAERSTLSTFDVILPTKGAAFSGWLLIYVLEFALDVTLLFLAIRCPRRWVFVTGACIIPFFVFWRFLTIRGFWMMEVLPIPRTLGYIALAFVLIGLFARPPRGVTQRQVKLG